MIILRSTGPVISTRRSCRSAGIGATFQSPSRMAAVSARKSGVSPASKRAWRVDARGEEVAAAGVEGAVEAGEEGQRLGGEDLGGAAADGAEDLGGGASREFGHVGSWSSTSPPVMRTRRSARSRESAGPRRPDREPTRSPIRYGFGRAPSAMTEREDG